MLEQLNHCFDAKAVTQNREILWESKEEKVKKSEKNDTVHIIQSLNQSSAAREM